MLTDHEDVVGLFNLGTIDSNTLVVTIEDVLFCMGLKLTQCRSQCDDGAFNMIGCKNGVANQLLAKEKVADLTHCYIHALNLAVGDSLKQLIICIDALDTPYKISKLLRFSPKWHAAFDHIRVNLPLTL